MQAILATRATDRQIILRCTKGILALVSCLVLFASCNRHPAVPMQSVVTEQTIHILPDYVDVTIPPNIAPLNFSVLGDSITRCVAQIDYAGGSLTYGEGRKVIIDADEWREMLSQSVGQSLQVQLYTEAGGQWRKHTAFNIHVAPDSIDRYVSYRLIPPYNTYERISLCQRNVEDFDEVEYYNNQMLDTPQKGHCINCHAFQNYSTERMQFHVREDHAGTVIYDQGKLGKYNMKLPETISGGVYPAWHPSLNLIAYSTNLPFLEVHTDGLTKSEVQDSESGLILYDVANRRVFPICNEADRLETFPSWSPDGKWLYYSVAEFTFATDQSSTVSKEVRLFRQHDITERYHDVHYDIYRRSFDASTLSFGEPEPVLLASNNAKSATLPRISPDGRWLLTSIGNEGCFHVYHPEADLYVTDLQAPSDSLASPCDVIGTTTPLTQANSDRAESYHNWSSNGRWIVFQSRRRDNNYTRLYFSWFDAEGKPHKAFELPQRDPDYELVHLNSYNIPEFTVEAIRPTPEQLAKTVLSITIPLNNQSK